MLSKLGVASRGVFAASRAVISFCLSPSTSRDIFSRAVRNIARPKTWNYADTQSNQVSDYSSFNFEHFCAYAMTIQVFLFNGIFGVRPAFWKFGIFSLNGSTLQKWARFNYIFKDFPFQNFDLIYHNKFFWARSETKKYFFPLNRGKINFWGYGNWMKIIVNASWARSNALFTLLFLRLWFCAALNSIDFLLSAVGLPYVIGQLLKTLSVTHFRLRKLLFLS